LLKICVSILPTAKTTFYSEKRDEVSRKIKNQAKQSSFISLFKFVSFNQLICIAYVLQRHFSKIFKNERKITNKFINRGA